MTDLIHVPLRAWELILHYPELDVVTKLARAANMGNHYVAGGYIRDKLNRKPFKDVDVFVPGDEPLRGNDGEAIRYDLTAAVEAVIDGVTVNIVGLREAHTFETILNRIDIGLCQIGVKDGEVFCTEAYLKDVRDNTITTLFAPATEQDIEHRARVAAKYPDMKLVDGW